MTHDTFERHHGITAQLRVSLDWMYAGISVVRAGNGSATRFSKLCPFCLDLESRLCHQTNGTMACNLKVRALCMPFCLLSKGHIVRGLYFLVSRLWLKTNQMCFPFTALQGVVQGTCWGNTLIRFQAESSIRRSIPLLHKRHFSCVSSLTGASEATDTSILINTHRPCNDSCFTCVWHV